MTNKDRAAVGIVSTGMYLPESIVTAADIAAESGIDEWVIREKFGIIEKRMAGPDDQPNHMAFLAAEECLAQCDISPEEIDLVLCTTEEWKEYINWTAGIDLAYQIGATNAWAMDMHMRCCTTISALKLAKDMIQSDANINTVLVAGGYRAGDFINLKNLRTTFAFNIGAGAGAMLLKRNWNSNHVLGSHLMADGSLSRHIVVPASGTLQHPTDEAVAKGLFYLDVFNVDELKDHLNQVSIRNWMFCIDEALRKSGYERSDLDFLNMILIKPSSYQDMLLRLGLSEEQGVYNNTYGHTGEQDSIINIIEGQKQGKLKEGDLMIIVAAGVGYVWGAACVRWGPCQS
ncbi:MAG: 3-oxoacyl-ACP synthase [Anaerolineales bacterium]|jgi:3-oxoacyl-[acyl-carrier-protein] synthase-3